MSSKAEAPKVIDIESLSESTCLLRSSERSRRYSGRMKESSVEGLETELNIEEYHKGDRHQLGRHIIMLLLLQLSMSFVSSMYVVEY